MCNHIYIFFVIFIFWIDEYYDVNNNYNYNYQQIPNSSQQIFPINYNDDINVLDAYEKEEEVEKVYYKRIYLDSINICPISDENINIPVALHCGHIFEKENVDTWIKHRENKHMNITCPTCKPITLTS